MDFNMKVDENFDFVIEEKGNSFVALRKLKWNEKSDTKLDLRKYMINSDGDEIIGKGVGFMTENGPHELVKIMVENGYGKTQEILVGIKDRDDFMSSLNKVLNRKDMDDVIDNNPDIDFSCISNEEDEELYDPREVL